MHLEQSIVGPGVTKLAQRFGMMSGGAIHRNQMLARASARINARGNIAYARERELPSDAVDPRDGHRRAARTAQSLMDPLEQGLGRKLGIQPQDTHGFRRRQASIRSVSQTIGPQPR